MPDDQTNLFAHSPPDDSRLREALLSMPLRSPPRSVLPALTARLARTRRERAQRRWIPLAAAAAVCALALLPWLRSADLAAPVETPQASIADDDSTAALIAQNQVFENALRSAAFGSRPLSARDALAGAGIEDLIGMLDLELSAASDPGTSKDLWQQRLVLLQELAAVRASGSNPNLTAQAMDLQPANYQIN
jgi:hypothetical protein